MLFVRGAACRREKTRGFIFPSVPSLTFRASRSPSTHLLLFPLLPGTSWVTPTDLPSYNFFPFSSKWQVKTKSRLRNITYITHWKSTGLYAWLSSLSLSLSLSNSVCILSETIKHESHFVSSLCVFSPGPPPLFALGNLQGTGKVMSNIRICSAVSRKCRGKFKFKMIRRE